jgi:hypothetical protein
LNVSGDDECLDFFCGVSFIFLKVLYVIDVRYSPGIEGSAASLSAL